MINQRRRFAAIILVLSLTFSFIAGYIVVESNNSLIDEYLLYTVMGKTFYSDVYVWYPNGKIKKISPSTDGIYYEAHINRQGNKVVFFGNDVGTPRLWIADLSTGRVVALTPETYDARHPVFSWDGRYLAFASGKAHDQELERIEFMHGNGAPPVNSYQNIFVMQTNGTNMKQVTFWGVSGPTTHF